MTPRIPPVLPAALQRRVLRAACRRPQIPQPAPVATIRAASARLFASTPIVARFPKSDRREESVFPAPTSALTALLSRLSLTPSPALQEALLACLTHPTYVLARQEAAAAREANGEASGSTLSNEEDLSLIETNEILSTLGNSLLGLFTTEHLSALYPHLPTEALSTAVTSYAGPASCVAVARELGVSMSGRQKQRDGRRGHGNIEGGIVVRWTKSEWSLKGRSASRHATTDPESSTAVAVDGETAVAAQRAKISYDEVVASVVRAFIGLIYQEQGMVAARNFVHAHFLSRHLDLTQLFNFKNPKHVLSSVVAKHLATAGVAPGDGTGSIESRVLASTGVNSQAPLFNVGLFLPSGLKLAEGHGSSLKMAEHRAATNALHSLFLVRSDTMAAGEAAPGSVAGPVDLPSEAHGAWAFEAGRVGAGSTFSGQAAGWGADIVVGSSKRSVRR